MLELEKVEVGEGVSETYSCRLLSQMIQKSGSNNETAKKDLGNNQYF